MQVQLPSDTQLQYVIYSRLRDPEHRKDTYNKDYWEEHWTYKDKERALSDLVWFNKAINGSLRLREYFMTVRWPKTPLNDPLPI